MSTASEALTHLTDEQCDYIANEILRASGSGLTHYSMPLSRENIRAAVRKSIEVVRLEALL